MVHEYLAVITDMGTVFHEIKQYSMLGNTPLMATPSPALLE